MSVPLYFDHNVPVAIAEGLRRLGHDVLTVFEDGAAEWDDKRVLVRSTELGRPVVTRDGDFLRLADEAWESGQSFAGVVFISDANTEIGRAVTDLHLVATAMTLAELESQVVFVPL